MSGSIKISCYYMVVRYGSVFAKKASTLAITTRSAYVTAGGSRENGTCEKEEMS